MAQGERYISIHLDEQGNLAGIDGPNVPSDVMKTFVNVSNDNEFPPMNVNMAIPIIVLGNKEGSPCSIIINGKRYCWPPCVC